MIKLSTDTEKLIDCLFEKEDERKMIRHLLESRCSNNIPNCKNKSPEGMERIRFSVIKLTKEGINEIDVWLDLAHTDWRDLFMAADFGRDIEAHLKWKKKVLTNGVV